jgi:hypothetical protein
MMSRAKSTLQVWTKLGVKPARRAQAPSPKRTASAPSKSAHGAETHAKDYAEGKADARARLKAVYNEFKGSGDELSALQLACTADLNLDQIKRIMATMPKRTRRATLFERMAAIGSPRIGSGDWGNQGGEKSEAGAAAFWDRVHGAR